MSKAKKLKMHEKQARQLASNAEEIESRKYSGYSTVERIDRTEAEKMKNGHLNTAQSSASDKFYEYYIGAQMGGSGSEIMERVDTSGAKFSIPDRVIHCQKKLAEASKALGMLSYTIVHKFVCEEQSAAQIAIAFGERPSTRVESYYRKRYRDACTELDRLWSNGSSTKRHNPQNERVSMFLVD